MLDKLFVRWIIRKLQKENCFQVSDARIDERIKRFYKSDSLSTWRVWGDERRVKLGEHTQVNNALFNTVSGSITVGDYTFFGHNVSLLTGTHNYHLKNMRRQSCVPNSGLDIYIGKGVWLASNVTVVAPCSIGDNAVVAANSVISGDVRANALYAGTPAKYIKDIYFEE